MNECEPMSNGVQETRTKTVAAAIVFECMECERKRRVGGGGMFESKVDGYE